MTSHRFVAFSDGVLAIIITIMVLEMKVPHGIELETLRPLANVMISYVLSFIYLAIYWNNHHHMMVLVEHINGTVLWANMHLLFWLSLVPFVTGWMGENHFAPIPVAAYGFVLLMASIAYMVLQRTIIAHQGADSTLSKAVSSDAKGKVSMGLYVVGTASALWNQWIAIGIYAFVAALWLVPDRRIESRVKS
jgi:uncharacterized membrane protein